jgi:hypothetical protein
VGSIVALSYMAAQRVFHYNDMADNKAYLGQLPAVWILFWKGQKLELILFPNHQRLQGWSSC